MCVCMYLGACTMSCIKTLSPMLAIGPILRTQKHMVVWQTFLACLAMNHTHREACREFQISM